LQKRLGKLYDEYELSSSSILKVPETDSVLLRGVAAQPNWPLHANRVSEDSDCIDGLNARKQRLEVR